MRLEGERGGMSGGLLQRMADGGPVSIRAKGLAAHGCATLPFDLHRQFGAAWLVAVGHIPQVAVGRSAPDGELLTVADLHGEEVFFKFHAETIHRLVYIFKRGLSPCLLAPAFHRNGVLSLTGRHR